MKERRLDTQIPRDVRTPLPHIHNVPYERKPDQDRCIFTMAPHVYKCKAERETRQ